jgi:hypothetical protein
MDRACRRHVGRVNVGPWRKNQKERDHYEDLDVGGRVRLEWILQ